MLGDAAPRWFVGSRSGLRWAGLGSPAKAADPDAGKSVFSSSCSICHSVQPRKEHGRAEPVQDGRP